MFGVVQRDMRNIAMIGQESGLDPSSSWLRKVKFSLMAMEKKHIVPNMDQWRVDYLAKL